MAFGNLGELIVYVWVDGPVSDAAFGTYLTEHVAFLDDSELITASLLITPSFSPSLRQRGMMKDQEAGLRMEAIRSMAVVSDSMIVRGGVMALSWMFPKKRTIKAFPIADLQVAAAWLQTQGVRAAPPAILTMVEQLRSMLVPQEAPDDDAELG